MSGWEEKGREEGYGACELPDLNRSEKLTPNVTPYKIWIGVNDVKVGKASEKNFSVVEGFTF